MWLLTGTKDRRSCEAQEAQLTWTLAQSGKAEPKAQAHTRASHVEKVMNVPDVVKEKSNRKGQNTQRNLPVSGKTSTSSESESVLSVVRLDIAQQNVRIVLEE